MWEYQAELTSLTIQRCMQKLDTPNIPSGSQPTYASPLEGSVEEMYF